MNELRYVYSLLTSKRNIFIIWIVISAIISILVWMFFNSEKKALLARERDQIRETVILKAKEVEELNRYGVADAATFSESPFFRKALNDWVRKPVNDSLSYDILKRLKLINNTNIYTDIIIATPRGEVLLSIFDTIKQLNSETADLINKVVASKTVLFTDFYRCQMHNDVHLDYIAPVFDNERENVTCVIIFRVNTRDKLLPIIEERPVLSKTSETVMVRRAGDSIVFLNELRRKQNTFLQYKIPLTDTNEVSVRAVLGHKGFYEGKNYLGHNVVAYISSVEGTPWYLIAKVEKDELYAPLYFRGRIAIVFTILLMFIIFLGLMSYHNYIKKFLYLELLKKEQLRVNYYKDFHTILHSIGDGVITTDTEGNVSVMNTVAEELTGWKSEQAKGRPIEEIFNIINEQTREKVENPIQKVIDKGIIVGLANHTILISRNGNEIPIADSAAPIMDELNLMQGVVLVFRDKTEEHLAEKRIRESEQRLKRAEIASLSGNWEVHLKTGEVYASVGAYVIYGIDPSKKLSLEDIRKIPLPHYRPLLDAALENMLEKGIPYDIEFKIQIRDSGEVKDIHSIAEYDKENNIVFGIIQDVTQRKKLEKHQLQLLNIVDNTLNEIYVFNADTLKFEYANKGALNNIGYTYQEMMELTPLDIKPYFTEESFREYIKPLLLGNEQKLLFETVHKRKDSSTYDVEIHLQFHRVDDTGVFFAVINDITGRKAVEQSLVQSQERWKNLFDKSPSSIAIYGAVDNGADFVFTDFNLLAQKTEGLKRDEVVGKRISEMFPAAEELGFLDVFRSVWKTGVTKYIEPTLYKDGRIEGWRENIIYRLNTGEIVAIYNDVSARMKAELALRASEEQYRLLFNNMTQGFALHEIIRDEKGEAIDYRYINVNPAFEHLTGLKRDFVIGKRVLEIMPETEKYWINVYGNVAATGEGVKYENFSKELNKYFEVNAFSPQKEQFAVVFSDVTKRRMAEEKIKMLSKGVEQSPAIVVITNTDGNIEYVNPTFSKITGYSFQEVIGQNPKILKSGNQDDEFYKNLWTTILHGNDWSGELLNKKKNGKYYWESALISPIKDERDVITHFIAIKEDITEKKKVEKALRDSETILREKNEELTIAWRKAEESDRLKTAFLANMSHEIRTPMNAIVGFSEVLLRPNLSLEKYKYFGSIINEACMQLLSVVNDVIDISKIETNQITLFEDNVNVNEIMKRIVSIFERSAERKKTRLSIDLSLPDEFSFIKTDETKFSQIINNLISNAIKFTDNGEITLGYKIANNRIDCFVRDTGIGISKENQQLIFERFRQVETTASRKYGGTGLGLSISKAFVELMGGEIWVESDLGKGSEFHFALPLKTVMSNNERRSQLMIESYDFNGKTILIAEDEPVNLVLLQNWFEDENVMILHAKDGAEAVQIVRTTANVDLVLMDIKMPVLDGIEATKQIRKFNANIPIIALTAYALSGDKDRCISAGCNNYLSKPLKKNDLMRVVREYLNRNQCD